MGRSSNPPLPGPDERFLRGVQVRGLVQGVCGVVGIRVDSSRAQATVKAELNAPSSTSCTARSINSYVERFADNSTFHVVQTVIHVAV